MQDSKYIYSFRYDTTESMLCKLESRCIFNKEEKNKQLLSNVKTDPSRSAFIKKRLDVITFSADYAELLDRIKKEDIRTDGFKVEYLILHGDSTRNAKRLEKLRDVGHCIDTFPEYHNPTITYGICLHEDIWYFGVLVKNSFAWLKHKQKPHSYSNSIKQNIAKALVNIATQSRQETRLLDVCCGVGTIMLEACFAGYEIEGCDISWKTCKNARANLSHFNYTGEVHCSDIQDLSKSYDAAIIDLPYNLYSQSTETDILQIIQATSKLASRVVIVSTAEITDPISKAGLRVVNCCNVSKSGKVNFTRRVWVCETQSKVAN